jgi:class 3 adenylate cyclase/tetratricopeptide (TPR) repeat protein
LETAAVPTLDNTESDGEQRRVTLMFADISGSTELVEHLDPEEAANLLDPLIATMTETAARHGGSVNPRGDGILAIFGIGGTAENNTVRACLAALEMLQSMNAAAPRVRIGIHHGEVALLSGRGGPTRENFYGAAIHAAARLEQSAEPGSACLSADAYALVRDFVEVEPLRPVQVKGLSMPLERLRLVSVRTSNRWSARLGRGLTPLVNRATELAAIETFLRDASSPGPHLMQVVGQAGIGKSRLVHEALRGEAAGACYMIRLAGPVHRGLAGYDPVAHWLRDLATASAGFNSPGRLHSPIARIPGATLLSNEDQEQLARYLGLGEAIPTQVAELDSVAPLSVVEPIATIVTHGARGRRVVLACEDAETLDDGRIDHVAAVCDAVAARGLTVMALISTRRALRFAANRFPVRKSLRVHALSPDEARQLLSRVHPESRRDSTLAGSILAKAGGNPLFIEEVAALLLARQSTSGADADQIDAIPDRIEALIADRLARVPQQALALLRVCAVLGNTFSPDLLPAVTGESAEAIRENLARLKVERLLVDVPAEPSPRLSFNHALVRDVAYRTLLGSRRRTIHEKVLRLLEQTEPAAGADDLSHHAVNARLWPDALRYLQQAAIVAAERAGYATAERHLRQALKVAETLPQDLPTRRVMVEIMVGLRSVLALDLRHDEADQLLQRAEALGGDLDPAIRLSIKVKRIRALNTHGRLREAMAVARESRREAGETGNVLQQLAATHFMGQTCFYTGRFAAGDAILTEGVALSPGGGDPDDVAVGSTTVLIPATRAGIRGFMGQFAAARRDAEQALSVAAAQNKTYDICFGRLATGMVALQRRDLTEAEAEFRQGLESAQRHGLRALVPSLNVGLGYALLLSGSLNEAIAALSEAHEIGSGSGRVLVRMWAATGLAAAYGSTGGRIPALRFADEAVQLGARHALRGFLVAALRCRGAVLAGEEETRDAGLRSVRQALALARKLGTRPDIAHCLATLAAITGGTKATADARAAYAALGMAAWAAHVLDAEAGAVPLCIVAA